MARLGRPAQPQAKFRLLTEQMRALIFSGEWSNRSVLPSQRQLCRKFAVKHKTVRLALDALTQEGHVVGLGRKRLQVHRHADALSVTHPTILILVTDNLLEAVRNQDFLDMHRGVLAGAGKHYLPLHLQQGYHLSEGTPHVIDNMAFGGVVVIGKLWDRALAQWERRKIPLVLVDHPPTNYALHTVSVDNRSGTRKAVEMLMEHGHRRIAFVRYASGAHGEDPDSLERGRTFRHEMRRHRLKVNNDHIVLVNSQTHARSVEWRKLFTARKKFSAVICRGERSALTLLEAAKLHGIQVPRDMSVVSFRSINSAAKHLTGPSIDFFDLGRRAMDLALKPCVPPIHERIMPVWHPGSTLL